MDAINQVLKHAVEAGEQCRGMAEWRWGLTGEDCVCTRWKTVHKVGARSRSIHPWPGCRTDARAGTPAGIFAITQCRREVKPMQPIMWWYTHTVEKPNKQVLIQPLHICHWGHRIGVFLWWTPPRDQSQYLCWKLFVDDELFNIEFMGCKIMAIYSLE